jgi:hypothetical protein
MSAWPQAVASNAIDTHIEDEQRKHDEGGATGTVS